MFFFLGCKQDSIKFQRESKFSEMVDGLNKDNPKQTIKKSSGVIILKDENTQKQNFNSPNFGPGEINFDLPIKIK